MLTLPNLPPIVAAHAAAAVACSLGSGQPPSALLVADMSEPNIAPRLWVFDLSDPEHPQLVIQAQIAHGYGSDPRRTGVATKFSDVEGSGMTSLGLYRVGDPYFGKHGPSYRLVGLSASNASAFSRAIMLHPADYVSPTRVSYSAGCAAVAPRTLAAMTSRFRTLRGAMLWIDGPGLQVPDCPARGFLTWKLPIDSVWRTSSSLVEACELGNLN